MALVSTQRKIANVSVIGKKLKTKTSPPPSRLYGTVAWYNKSDPLHITSSPTGYSIIGHTDQTNDNKWLLSAHLTDLLLALIKE